MVHAPSPTMATAAAGVHHLLAGEGDGPAGEELLQLGEGHQAPGERRRPDHQAEHHLEHVQAAGMGGLHVQERPRSTPGRRRRRRPR